MAIQSDHSRCEPLRLSAFIRQASPFGNPTRNLLGGHRTDCTHRGKPGTHRRHRRDATYYCARSRRRPPFGHSRPNHWASDLGPHPASEKGSQLTQTKRTRTLWAMKNTGNSGKAPANEANRPQGPPRKTNPPPAIVANFSAARACARGEVWLRAPGDIFTFSAANTFAAWLKDATDEELQAFAEEMATRGLPLAPSKPRMQMNVLELGKYKVIEIDPKAPGDSMCCIQREVRHRYGKGQDRAIPDATIIHALYLGLPTNWQEQFDSGIRPGDLYPKDYLAHPFSEAHMLAWIHAAMWTPSTPTLL